MSTLYLECKSGISGDMTVAALLDLGADKNVLENVLKTIPLKGFKTEIKRVQKSGIDVCDFDVILENDNHDHDMNYLFNHEHNENRYNDHEHSHDHVHTHGHEHEEHHHEHGHVHTQSHEHVEHHHHHEHRGLKEIEEIIAQTQMPENARKLAVQIFEILAEAESKAHNKPVNEVHFHEVGAVDSIVDIISIAVCFDNLGIKKVIVPEMCEGSGTIRCQHGILPIPVPAVSNIARDFSLPLKIISENGEFITPTGAAFVAAVMTSSKLPESFVIKKIGMGAGKRAYNRPNFLRAFLIEETPQKEEIYKLETNIDDSSGEALGFVMEQLLLNGALDVHYLPCFMKKNRPGWLLSVLCEEEKAAQIEKIIFMQTTTIGIRRTKVERTKLARKEAEVQTAFGKVAVKQVELPDGSTRNYPEYESVAEICRKNNHDFWTVYNAAVKN